MGALLAGLASGLRGLGIGALAGVKADPAKFLTRLARGNYVTTAGSISFLWYTGWRRQRVPKGVGKFPIPGISKDPAQYPASLSDSPLSELDPANPANSDAPTTANPLNAPTNAPGTGAKGGGNKHENFDPIRYTHRLHTAQKIANQFRLTITSGHRTAAHNAQVGGVPGSLHVDGLAFDFVGAIADMQRAMAWAQGQPNVFSEVLVHNVGSGLHLHLGFWPNTGL